MKSIKQLFIFFFLFEMASANAQIFVDASATGLNDGSSWTDAYTDLNNAVINATPNAELWVAAGTYGPGPSPTDRILLFFDLKLYGGFNGTETALSQRDYQTNITILSGDVLNDDVPGDFTINKSDNNLHIIWCHSSVTNSTVIDGFTIERGNALDVNGSGDDRRGGGILSYGSPIVQNCLFRDNYAFFGAALYPRNSDANDTKVFNCIFENNFSDYGPAIMAAFSEVLVENCIIRNNHTTEGSAFTCNSSSAVIKNTDFISNTGGLFSGSAFFAYQGNASDPEKIVIEDCTFDQNTSQEYGAAAGIWDLDVTAIINRCTFTANNSAKGGAALTALGNSSTTITNCVFKDNIASQGGAILVQDSSYMLIDSCLFEANEANVNEGGAIIGFASNTTLIKNSIFKDNKASSGGAIYGFLYGGVDYHIDIENSYFTGNEAINDGGAFNLFSTNLALTNCVVAENTAAIGSAVYANANGVNQTMGFTNTTIAGHIGAQVIANEAINNGGSTLELLNTIIDNPGLDNYVELAAGTSAVSNGGNLSSDATLTSVLINTNDLNNTSANFFNAPGGDYHLTSTSPSVNKGMTAGAPLLDIEGNARVGDTDMGAYEFQGMVNTDDVLTDSDKIQVFPNPVAKQLNMTLDNQWNGSFEVRIIDMKGSTILSKELNKTSDQINHSLDIGYLPAGVYQLNLSKGSLLEVKTFVKD